MKKPLLKPITIFVIVLIGITACTTIKIIPIISPTLSMSSEEKQQIIDKASQATIDYFKKEKNIDVIITKTKFSGETGGGTIFINGKFSNEQTTGFSVAVDWKNNYEVHELK